MRNYYVCTIVTIPPAVLFIFRKETIFSQRTSKYFITKKTSQPLQYFQAFQHPSTILRYDQMLL